MSSFIGGTDSRLDNVEAVGDDEWSQSGHLDCGGFAIRNYLARNAVHTSGKRRALAGPIPRSARRLYGNGKEPNGWRE